MKHTLNFICDTLRNLVFKLFVGFFQTNNLKI